MKVAIFGAGAIGGFLGVKLAQAGVDVTFVARGPHLAAMQANGVTLRSGGDSVTVRPRCVASAEEAGVQDYVVVTLKAHGLPAAAPSIAAMMGPDSALVTGVNGIPYWYFYGLDGPYRDRVVESVDPGGRLWDVLPPSAGDRLRRLSGGRSGGAGRDRAHLWRPLHLGRAGWVAQRRVSKRCPRRMIAAGLKAPVRPRIRDELWVKLWGNLAFNPISALTASTLDRITGDDELRACAAA